MPWCLVTRTTLWASTTSRWLDSFRPQLGKLSGSRFRLNEADSAILPGDIRGFEFYCFPRAWLRIHEAVGCHRVNERE